ncbi:MAG: discoidin domain-containing protein, partial [Gemmatimonas sp.]
MICAAALLTLALQGAQPDVVLDDFETTNGWKATPSDGVSLELHEDAGIHGKSMRLDFDFHRHGGYAVIHKDIKVTVPGNYEFSFYVRGPAPLNTLEFKLIDPTGDNVWWSNQPNFVFPADWKHVVRKKRHITFAWGPIGGGELKNVAAIEFAITAGTGGKGSVWLDDLRLTPLPPEGPYTLTPKITASSSVSRHDAAMAIDGNATTSWRVAPGHASTLDIDFLRRREFGGLVLDWEKNARPASYSVSTSIDGSSYSDVYSASGSSSLRDYLYLPESDARYLRISVAPSESFVGLKEITVKPLAWSRSMNDFLQSVSKDSPLGSYPRYYTNKQSYW